MNRILSATSLIILLLATACATRKPEKLPLVPKYSRFEQSFQGAKAKASPAPAQRMVVSFIAPSGKIKRCLAFQDGPRLWRVRFAPDEIGRWEYLTESADVSDKSLHHQRGAFLCVAPAGNSIFEKHGFLGIAHTKRHLAYEDGTPFLWLGAPVDRLSQDAWPHEIAFRHAEQFSVIQWPATPLGAYTHEGYFAEVESRSALISSKGMVSAPVLTLGKDKDSSIAAARQLAARLNAEPVVWILDARAATSQDVIQLGQAVFGGGLSHAPVVLWTEPHQWPAFENEQWFDIIGAAPQSATSIAGSKTKAPQQPQKPVLLIGHQTDRSELLARLLGARIAGATGTSSGALAGFLKSIEWWRLESAPSLVAGEKVATGRTPDKDIAVVYAPSVKTVSLNLNELPRSAAMEWVHLINGETKPVTAVIGAQTCDVVQPEGSDWVLLLRRK